MALVSVAHKLNPLARIEAWRPNDCSWTLGCSFHDVRIGGIRADVLPGDVEGVGRTDPPPAIDESDRTPHRTRFAASVNPPPDT